MEWTKVPRKMCASGGGVRAAHMAAAGQQRESTGRGERTGRTGGRAQSCPCSGGAGAAGTPALVLPRLPWAIACPLQAAPRGWLTASLVPIGFFSYELARLPWGVVFLPTPALVLDMLTP